MTAMYAKRRVPSLPACVGTLAAAVTFLIGVLMHAAPQEIAARSVVAGVLVGVFQRCLLDLWNALEPEPVKAPVARTHHRA